MVTKVVSDFVDGHEYNKVLAGFEISRVFRVTGLTEIPSRQLIEASLMVAPDIGPGIPQIGAVYPGTFGILVVRHQVQPDGPNAARVTCFYSARKNVSSYNQPEPTGNDGQDVKQISAGFREVATSQDRFGVDMTLTPPAGSGDGWPSYVSEARVFVPTADIVFERVETTPAVARARNKVGRVNDAALGNYAVNTLLFVALDATSNDGGYLWNCTYTFRYDAGGWQHRDSYHSPLDGKVAEGAIPQLFDVLEVTSFTSLDLDFSDSQTPIT